VWDTTKKLLLLPVILQPDYDEFRKREAELEAKYGKINDMDALDESIQEEILQEILQEISKKSFFGIKGLDIQTTGIKESISQNFASAILTIDRMKYNSI
jgi:TRAP-type C4-dicarboxylate transport system substrate-binding protein